LLLDFLKVIITTVVRPAPVIEALLAERQAESWAGAYHSSIKKTPCICERAALFGRTDTVLVC
jgi:hypothetical protein